MRPTKSKIDRLLILANVLIVTGLGIYLYPLFASVETEDAVNLSLRYDKLSPAVAHVMVINAKRYGISPDLAYAMIRKESQYKVRALSNRHLEDRMQQAHGLLQLMPDTAWSTCPDLFSRGDFEDLYTPGKNVACGIRYFSEMLKQFHNRRIALYAYNQGPNKTRRLRNRPVNITVRNYANDILYWQSNM